MVVDKYRWFRGHNITAHYALRLARAEAATEMIEGVRFEWEGDQDAFDGPAEWGWDAKEKPDGTAPITRANGAIYISKISWSSLSRASGTLTMTTGAKLRRD